MLRCYVTLSMRVCVAAFMYRALQTPTHLQCYVISALLPPTYARFSDHQPRLWSDCSAVRGSRICQWHRQCNLYPHNYNYCDKFPLFPYWSASFLESTATSSRCSFSFCNGRPLLVVDSVSPGVCVPHLQICSRMGFSVLSILIQYWTDPVLVHNNIIFATAVNNTMMG